jgi:hypothetical protein
MTRTYQSLAARAMDQTVMQGEQEMIDYIKALEPLMTPKQF